MKLINNFFTLNEVTEIEKGFKCGVKFNKEHTIYKAHFPGNPITPGVCLVQMALEILNEKFDKEYNLHSIQNIKFRLPIEPHLEPTFYFHIKHIDEDLKVYVEISAIAPNSFNESAEEIYTKMTLTIS